VCVRQRPKSAQVLGKCEPGPRASGGQAARSSRNSRSCVAPSREIGERELHFTRLRSLTTNKGDRESCHLVAASNWPEAELAGKADKTHNGSEKNNKRVNNHWWRVDKRKGQQGPSRSRTTPIGVTGSSGTLEARACQKLGGATRRRNSASQLGVATRLTSS